MRAAFLAAIVAVIFFTSPPAGAETLIQTLESFGFFGRWAIDCNAPSSPDNTVRTSRILPTGEPAFSESLGGEGQPNSYVILRVKPAGADKITLRIKLNGEYRQDLTMHRQDNRLRTITNREVDTRKYVVRNGAIVANGHATPWLTRCEHEPTVRQQT